MAMEGKNNLSQLLQERFSGHEVPAPDGAWEAISSQLTLSAAASADGVNDLFRERFAQHEAYVDPSVWSSIEGQLGGAAGGAGAGAGWATVAGWAAAGVAALLMTAGVVLWNEDKNELPEQKAVAAVPAPQQQVQQNTAISEPVAASTEKITDASEVNAPRTLVTEPVVQPVVMHPRAVHADVAPQGPAVVPTVTPTAPQDNTTVTTAVSTLPEEVISEMLKEADHEVLQPASVPDTALDDDGPVMPPPVFGAEPPAEEFHVFLPNVFTPYNHDGINDEYLPQGEGFSSVIIRVYSVADNRLVFSSNELAPWDGKDMTTGEDCAEGHYLYALEVIGTDGKVRTQGQVVLLMR